MNAADTLTSNHQFVFLDDVIDKGYSITGPGLSGNLLVTWRGYAQRRDGASGEIKRIAMRVLKRNPRYIETANYDVGTYRFFQDDWNDPEPGKIPWDDIHTEMAK